MYDTYRKVMRAQRQGTHGSDAKTMLLLLALVAMGGSAVYWWGVQSGLTTNKVVAVAYTAILVLAPPVLVSFLIPWSPGGMLLQKVHARTWGFPVVIGAALYLIYYSFQIQWSWWAAQPVVAETGLIWQQVLIGIIGFIIIPALLWTPVSDEELVEKVKQAHLVKRYEMQTAADIAILDATLLRHQTRATVGLANLSGAERQELADAQRQLVSGIDTTLQRIAGNMNEAAQTVYGAHGRDMFSAPAFADDLAGILEYIATALDGMRIGETTPALPAPDDASLLERARSASEGTKPHEERDTETHRTDALPDDAARRHNAPYTDQYRIARRALRDAWTVKDLARVLAVEESTARGRKGAWEQAGLVSGRGLPNGRYSFTEHEVQ